MPQTIEETGLPGRPRSSIAPSRPCISGLPGRRATRQKPSSCPGGPAPPARGRARRPRRRRASRACRRRPRARPRCARSRASSVSRAMPRSTASPPACSTDRRDRERVRGDDLVGAGRLARRARVRRRWRGSPRAGSRRTRESRVAHGGGEREAARVEALARLQKSMSPCREIEPGRADECSGAAGSRPDDHASPARLGVLLDRRRCRRPPAAARR